MVEELIEDATQRMYHELSGQPPLVESKADDGTRWSLYHLVDGSQTPEGRGLYAVTSSEDDGVVNTVRHYGVPEDAEFTTPKYEYLDRCPDEYEDLIHDHYDLLKMVETNSMRDAFRTVFNESRNAMTEEEMGYADDDYDALANEMRRPDPESAIAVKGRTIFVSREMLDRELTLEEFVERDQRSFGDSQLSEDEAESVDWEAFGEVTREAVFGWRREEKAYGVVSDDWEGYAVLIDYDDWRPTARDLAMHTSLSDAQAAAVAVAGLDFSQQTVADILGKDNTTISHQLKSAGDKFVRAEKTVEKMGDVSSHTLSGVIGNAEERERGRIADLKQKQSRSPEVGFYRCPNCGRDTGAWSGARDTGGFETEEPIEFITSTIHHPQAGGRGGRPVEVECPKCNHTAQEDRFISAWTDEHGSIPEPDHVPHPEPTAERLHRQARDAAESKRRQRDNRRF